MEQDIHCLSPCEFHHEISRKSIVSKTRQTEILYLAITTYTAQDVINLFCEFTLRILSQANLFVGISTSWL